MGRVFQAEGTAKAEKDEVFRKLQEASLGELRLGLSTCPAHRRPPENVQQLLGGWAGGRMQEMLRGHVVLQGCDW